MIIWCRQECDSHFCLHFVELIKDWEANDVISVTHNDEIDTEGFKNATKDVAAWYKEQLVKGGKVSAEEAEALVNAFTN